MGGRRDCGPDDGLPGLTGVGAIIVAIIGLIDSVVQRCSAGSFIPMKTTTSPRTGRAKACSGILAEGVAYVIYDTTNIIDLDNPNRLTFRNFNPYLADPKAGFAAGAALRMDLLLENTIKTESRTAR